eukprot:2580072-Alexandrium_andersonii.AAC.1
MGRGEGRVGLAGRGSVHLMELPAVLWLLRRARPDVDVQFMLANPPDIAEPHRAVIKTILGVAENDWVVMRSPGPFRRDRAFISTMPNDACSRRLPRRRDVL